MNPDGIAYVLMKIASSGVYANRNDGSWTGDQFIGSGNGTAPKPWIAVGGDANAMIVWLYDDGTCLDIMYRRWDYVTGLDTVGTLFDGNATDGSAVDVDVGMDDAGNAIAIWCTQYALVGKVWASYYTAGGTWSAAVMLNTTITGYAYQARVTMNAGGTAVGAWQQKDASNHRWLYARRYAVGSWSPVDPARIQGTGDDTYDHVLAMNDSGRAWAIYNYGGSGGTVWGNTTTTATWASDTQMDGGSNNRNMLCVAAHASGARAIAIWNYYNTSLPWHLYYRIHSGTSWGTTAQLESEGTYDATNAAAAFGVNGEIFTAWEQYDGTRTNIWYRLYR
jgi:hypothetical protein